MRIVGATMVPQAGSRCGCTARSAPPTRPSRYLWTQATEMASRAPAKASMNAEDLQAVMLAVPIAARLDAEAALRHKLG